MIRLRTTSGADLPVPADVQFVEVVNDQDGTIGMVVCSPRPGAVLTINPGTADAERYEGLFHRVGVRFASQIIHRAS